MNVAARSDPLHNHILSVAHRQTAADVPSVLAVGALEAMFDLNGRAGAETLFPRRERVREIVWMDKPLARPAPSPARVKQHFDGE